MLTKSQINHIKQLSEKKYRQAHHQFIIEGDKLVKEACASPFSMVSCFATEKWFQQNENLLSPSTERVEIKETELHRISFWQTPQPVVAIMHYENAEPKSPSGFNLILDRVQDPGNVGTIVRIADWYGIEAIYATEETADVFNPKVIQASMGSIFRVPFYTVNAVHLIESAPHIPVIATTLNGTSLSQFTPQKEGFLLLGNESKGVSTELLERSQHRITIPRKGKAESLNVAVAAGIICSHLLS